MINYALFVEQHLSGVLALQHEWFCENITFGVIPETPEDILQYQNNYFFVAVNSENIIGYITAEVVIGNEYNVFPKDASFLRINDLYIAKDYRSQGIGEKLLSLVEEQAHKNGLIHIFISSATKDTAAVRNFYARNGYDIWTTMFYKRTDWDVRTYNLGELDGYRFVVILARYKDKWLYSRHRERDTFETAGGHIEQGETPLEAAKRELFEETGAIKFDIWPAFDYSVHTPTGYSNGQVFYAEVEEIDVLPESEMAEIRLFDATPDSITYPKILPVLYDRMQSWINLQSSKDEIWDVYDSDRNLTGRTHRRGYPLASGDYHLVVHVWIQNGNSEYLITKRTPNKGFPNMWECTGGSAIFGDDSLSAAIREVKEETGLSVSTSNGRCVFTIQRDNAFCDVWLFKQDFNIADVILQENETCDAKWASKDEIRTMIKANAFISFHYIEQLFMEQENG